MGSIPTSGAKPVKELQVVRPGQIAPRKNRRERIVGQSITTTHELLQAAATIDDEEVGFRAPLNVEAAWNK